MIAMLKSKWAETGRTTYLYPGRKYVWLVAYSVCEVVMGDQARRYPVLGKSY